MTANAASLRDLPPFADFPDDLAVLGVTIEATGRDGPLYAVNRASSNPRWWLVPFGNRAAAAAGIDMLQPVTLAARAAKKWITLLARIGPHAVLGKENVAFSGILQIAGVFGGRAIHVAYFTGSDSLRRKSANRFIENAASIIGYGKISRRNHVRHDVRHEAPILQKFRAMSLCKANIMSVVAFVGEAVHSVLVLNSCKSAFSRVDTTFTPAWRFEAAQTNKTP